MPDHSLQRPLAVGCALALLSTLAAAQTPPDAGALQQQIERERQQQLPKRLAPEKPATPAAMKPTSGVVITVKQFRFAGNTLLTAEQLAPTVVAYLNRPLDFAQLNAAAAAVAETYRAAGWVVNAYLPQQDIKEGVVTIQIVEAVFGKLKIEGPRPQRMSTSQIDAIFAKQQHGGQILNNAALDRALLLADDLPGVAVAGSLAPGASERETDLVLKMADEPLAVGDAALDNTGSRSSGADRLTANLNLNSPVGFGDLLNANLIHTQGSDYLRLGYTLPLGADGWRVGANTSHMSYKVLNEFSATGLRGSSTSTGLEASYPLIRMRMSNLYLNLNFDHKQFDNQASTGTESNYRVDVLSLGLNGNLFDNLGGGGANSGSLALVSGRLKLGAIDSNEKNPGLDGNFSKLRYSLSRQQVITNDLSLYAALNGQDAPETLDTSEQFYLGGASGVRAYPASEAGGASGQLATLELRWKLPENFTLTGFYDHGHIANDAPGNSYSLKGSGVALGWKASFGLNLKATWARRIGTHPAPAADGIHDQDGSLTKNRLWLNASLPF